MKRIFLLLFLLLGLLHGLEAQNSTNRQIVLQGFWWDYWNANYPNGWANYLAELAPRLRALGIDAVWIPPTVKNPGTNSVGYVPFDHYDLGDKYQKNNVKTRMGDKDELLRMMAVMKANGLDVIQDIVLNHMNGAGAAIGGAGGQDPGAMDDGQTNKFKNFRYACYKRPVINENNIDYLARSGRFPKNWQNFYPNPGNPCCTNDINSPWWGPDISYEANAFGQSSNASFNPTQDSDYMRKGMRDWIIWYKKQQGWDGVRLDAIKHFPSYITEDYLWNLQFNSGFASGGNDMFAVGEWVGGKTDLDNWANSVQNRSGTFDFALRNALVGIVNGIGNFDLGSVPSYQQNNRQRTVPFVNNHDTFRPILSTAGNYTGWNQSQQLGLQIEPNDPRLAVVYGIILAVDGAPQIFFEDLFDVGYTGKRYSHQPFSETDLPIRSDIANLIWCHQNLRFKQGAYFVRWQAQDALVIERGGRALIALNDNWNTWQNLNGVQTTFPDGTPLKDYSGANGTAIRTVYGGGKVDISVPPCDGSALQGRRGYAVWAPVGITTNYTRTRKTITQEWEMEDDLGDSHVLSLRQGGRLPDSSLQCRTVSKIFVTGGQPMRVELFTSDTIRKVNISLLDAQCNFLDSTEGAGTVVYNYTPILTGWLTIVVRNADSVTMGQKVYVKATYRAPDSINTTLPKPICNCNQGFITSNEEVKKEESIQIWPNPVKNEVFLEFNGLNHQGLLDVKLLDLEGRILQTESIAYYGQSSSSIDLSHLRSGLYFIEIHKNKERILVQKIVKQ